MVRVEFHGTRDRARIAAWTATAAVGLSLLFAGFVYEPPPSIDTLVGGAGLYLKMGMADAARHDLEKVLDREPDHPQANLLMACISQAAGDYRAALEQYEKARPAVRAAKDPDFLAEYTVAVGLLRLACCDFLGAERDANRLIATDSRQAAGFVIWAFSRLGAGDDTDFRQGLARAYSLDPLDPIFRIRGEFISEAIPWAAAFCIGN